MREPIRSENRPHPLRGSSGLMEDGPRAVGIEEEDEAVSEDHNNHDGDDEGYQDGASRPHGGKVVDGSRTRARLYLTSASLGFTCPEQIQPGKGDASIQSIPLSPPMANYYLHRDGQNHGPFPADEIQQLISSGQVGAGEMICEEGGSEWTAASTLVGAAAAAGPARRVAQPRVSTAPRRVQAAAADSGAVTQEQVDVASQAWRSAAIGITLSIALPALLLAAKFEPAGARSTGRGAGLKELAKQNTDLLPIAMIIGVIGLIVCSIWLAKSLEKAKALKKQLARQQGRR